jgi:serine/threonine-protein kinase HipA
MARSKQRPLDVYLNSRLVGQLRREPSGAIFFQYDRTWLEWESAMPVSLSLPLRKQEYSGAPVLAVFDNLLPDNNAIRRRVAERAHAEGTDAYSLLGAIGHDCVGALQFLPQGAAPTPAGAVDAEPVGEREISELLHNLGTAPLGITEDDSFRISIAGAQEKTALLRWKNRWHKPHGTTATTHIFKPSIGKLQNGIDLTASVENEYLCLKILDALGIPAAKAEMASFGDTRVLIVERFDRLWTQDKRLLRLPQEDCCQALSVPPTLKYQGDGGPGIENILRLLRGSDEPLADQRLFMKANIVFWMLGATDGHAKNFSIFLSPGGRFRLTPLYDVVSAQPNVDKKQIPWKHYRLAMAVGTTRHWHIRKIVKRHFIETGERAGLAEAVTKSIVDELLAGASQALESAVSRLPKEFPEEISASIASGAKRRLQLLATP